jgi:hypothetical protein
VQRIAAPDQLHKLGAKVRAGFVDRDGSDCHSQKSGLQGATDFHHEAKRDGIDAAPAFGIVRGIATGFRHIGNDGGQIGCARVECEHGQEGPRIGLPGFQIGGIVAGR